MQTLAGTEKTAVVVYTVGFGLLIGGSIWFLATLHGHRQALQAQPPGVEDRDRDQDSDDGDRRTGSDTDREAHHPLTQEDRDVLTGAILLGFIDVDSVLGRAQQAPGNALNEEDIDAVAQGLMDGDLTIEDIEEDEEIITDGLRVGTEHAEDERSDEVTPEQSEETLAEMDAVIAKLKSNDDAREESPKSRDEKQTVYRHQEEDGEFGFNTDQARQSAESVRRENGVNNLRHLDTDNDQTLLPSYQESPSERSGNLRAIERVQASLKRSVEEDEEQEARDLVERETKRYG